MNLEASFENANDERTQCPNCRADFQILNPMEGLVYSCTQCQAQFMLKKKGQNFQSFLWSEEEILKKLLEIPGQAGPSQLARLWKKVFSELENESHHRNFVELCVKLNQLECAREKYAQLKTYLNWTAIPEEQALILYPEPKTPSPWRERMPWILLGFAGTMMMAGLVLPASRNMFGAGFMVALLTTIFYWKTIKSLVK